MLLHTMQKLFENGQYKLAHSMADKMLNMCEEVLKKEEHSVFHKTTQGFSEQITSLRKELPKNDIEISENAFNSEAPNPMHIKEQVNGWVSTFERSALKREEEANSGFSSEIEEEIFNSMANPNKENETRVLH